MAGEGCGFQVSGCRIASSSQTLWINRHPEQSEGSLSAKEKTLGVPLVPRVGLLAVANLTHMLLRAPTVPASLTRKQIEYI